MLIHQALAVILPFPYVGVWTVVSGLWHRVILYSCIHSPPQMLISSSPLYQSIKVPSFHICSHLTEAMALIISASTSRCCTRAQRERQDTKGVLFG